MNLEQTLAQRKGQHGDFTKNADLSQQFKDIIRSYDAELNPLMREALDMIAHKIARILSGDPKHKDHWHDIAGYATLVEERI
jgi:hypothetical protein